jgi:hypothetical protein
MIETKILDNIPFKPNVDEWAKTLRIKPDSDYFREFESIVNEAIGIARPKAMYGIAYVDQRGETYIEAGGRRFDSRILRVNLDGANRVFPFVVTCGREMEAWSERFSEILHRFWADSLMEFALKAVRISLTDHLSTTLALDKVSFMSPGSLEDWPLDQQKPLFELLGDTEAAVGVKLTDSFLMRPLKSVSGIIFPTEESFQSCMLCPKENCRGRRAKYDPDLYERKYRNR